MDKETMIRTGAMQSQKFEAATHTARYPSLQGPDGKRVCLNRGTGAWLTLASFQGSNERGRDLFSCWTISTRERYQHRPIMHQLYQYYA